MRCRISGGMPGPVSFTSSTASPVSSVRVLTRMSLLVGGALGDRLGRVDQQVDHHLTESPCVGLHARDVTEPSA